MLRPLSLLTLAGLLMSALSLNFPPAAAEDVLLTEFHTGDKFYLDTKSIKPAGEGKLTYQIKSESSANPNNPGKQVTQNMVDCRDGTNQSRTKSWDVDAGGKLGNEKSFYTTKIALRNPNSKLYKALKEACQTHVPKHTGSW